MRRLAVAAALLAALAQPAPARACAHARPHGERVSTQSEDALIVWDEAHHTEQFIRSAVFDTSADSFGFLVPTPSRPALSEVDSGLFEALGAVTRAEQVVERRYHPFFSACAAPFLMARDAPRVAVAAPAVRVLEQTQVAGLDAAVLEADDAGALEAWLRGHGYEFRPALRDWVAPYLARNWVVTAFRYQQPSAEARQRGAGSRRVERDSVLASRAVRMSFTADAPFYPYREPADTAEQPGRRLRLFLAAPARFERGVCRGGGGALGHGGRVRGEAGGGWRCDAVLAADVGRAAAGALADGVY